jgi:heme/copper-type cytochrome/quinol oxidase subunit 2
MSPVLAQAHDALAPAGPQAGRIAGLIHLHLWVSVAVLALVTIALLAAVLRRRRGPDRLEVDPPSTDGAPPVAPITAPDPAAERRRALWVAAATGATVLVLGVLLGASVGAGRAIDLFGKTPRVDVKVIGHQWWWELQYLAPDGAHASLMFHTANELHVPVGRPIRLELESRDVNHSFWVPSLHGKMDLIPGEKNHLVLQADEAGVYRGQCAEFCGVAHARMGSSSSPRTRRPTSAGSPPSAGPPPSRGAPRRPAAARSSCRGRARSATRSAAPEGHDDAAHTGLLGALLALAPAPLYRVYVERAGPAGIDALADQQVAGLLMWVPAGVILTCVALALFAAWFGEAERRATRRRAP